MSSIMREETIKVKLKAICDLKNGFAFKSKDYVNHSKTMNFRMSQIRPGGKVNLEHNPKFLPDNYKEKYEDYLLQKGDMVIAMTDMASDTKILGVPTQIKETALNLLLNQRVGKITDLKDEFIDISYLRYIITSPQIYSYYKALGKGGMQINLGKNDILNAELPFFSLPTQKAIVKKIEALFSSLDSGITDLKKAQNQLVIYRQAVLKKAFEGEFTKEWREKQTNLPSALELLEQIKEERKKHYVQQIADWKEAVKVWEKNQELGKKPKKPKKQIDYPEIEQTSTLPILNLGELVFQISNKMMPNEAPEFPFIGMDCLEKNALKPHFTYKFKEFKSAGNWFNKNHVLYGRLRPYLNKVYQAEYEGVASGEFIILETIKGLNPNYLKLILHQQDFVHWSNNQSAGDKPRVKFDQIALYPIKVPTIQEQHQIVQEIESRLSVCDTVEKDIADSLEKAQALRQSILKKAFDGKLLNEDEIAKCKEHKDYEPASVLLEKIKAEKKK